MLWTGLNLSEIRIRPLKKVRIRNLGLKRQIHKTCVVNPDQTLGNYPNATSKKFLIIFEQKRLVSVCPKSLDPWYIIVINHRNRVKTSCIYCSIFPPLFCVTGSNQLKKFRIRNPWYWPGLRTGTSSRAQPPLVWTSIGISRSSQFYNIKLRH